SARIIPIREEQLKEKLGDSYRRLDVPLLVEWPDGRRQAVLFVLEEETDPGRFSIHRLIRYCIDLSELFSTDRIIPVVIFLRDGRFPVELTLGSDQRDYLRFSFIACELARLPADRYQDSDNIVARLNLPNMLYPREKKVDMYAHALRGLFTLEPDIKKQIKYLDFIDLYAGLDENEQLIYQQRYPEEEKKMKGFAERYREEGMQKGIQKGLLKGIQETEVSVLVMQLQSKFGDLPEGIRTRIENADSDTLLCWLDRVLTADSIDEVIH
ncbi:MAG: hypothetical protein D3911_13510, partial [Candidatus Electrothrix sp. AW3_4]|nr:hypothetical protein [Candidatus Electrothrix gigas]